MALVALASILVAGACTTRTAGMQSPLGHDYDGLQWRPLDHSVSQAVTVAPAYTALVENDPSTSPDELRARIDALPADVRGSELVELQVLVRPLDELVHEGQSSVVMQVFDRSEAPVGSPIEAPLASLATDDDWLVLEDVPAAEAGDTLLIELGPGEGVAPGWEYAITPGRSPYGGEPATAGPDGATLSGALGFQTVFAQRTDSGAVAGDLVDAVADGFWGDSLLGLLYAALLVGIVALIWFHARLERGNTRDGG
jgi:hypothetical protein